MNPILKRLLSTGRMISRGNLAATTALIQKQLRAAAQAAAKQAQTPRAPPQRPRSTAPPAQTTASSGGRTLTGTYNGPLGSRAWVLAEPAKRSEAVPPLVVMLHGCTQDPADFARGTRMTELAGQHGWPVLYVAQPPRSNTNKCWNWFLAADQHRGAGEPGLLAALVAHVAGEHALDTRRVFVAGLSAGGAMAAILAREYPDAFVAAGVHSGLRAGAAHDVASAFSAMRGGSSAGKTSGDRYAPLIVFHGEADRTVAAINGRQLVDAALAGMPWTSSTESGSAGRRYDRTVYRRKGALHEEPAPVELWLVDGAGHAWSGGDPAGSYADPIGPDASAEMLRFFAAHAAGRKGDVAMEPEAPAS